MLIFFCQISLIWAMILHLKNKLLNKKLGKKNRKDLLSSYFSRRASLKNLWYEIYTRIWKTFPKPKICNFSVAVWNQKKNRFIGRHSLVLLPTFFIEELKRKFKQQKKKICGKKEICCLDGTKVDCQTDDLQSWKSM